MSIVIIDRYAKLLVLLLDKTLALYGSKIQNQEV